VFDHGDVDERIQVVSAEDLIADGRNDYIEASVSEYGDDAFIISGGVEGLVYMSHHHVGLSNLFVMMLQQPDLLDYLISRQLEQTIERIRCLAAAGGDAIYVDDAMTTSDVISVAQYERFSLPAMTALVDEIHRLGHKAMDAEIRRQVQAGRPGRGLILSPANPLTPSTPIARIQRFIERGREIGRAE
jgi:uroporphyrinogen-III decarboxylase